METIQSPQAVVKIPLEQILVVPEDNPRGPYVQQEVEAMALSLKLGGQQVPILLRPRKDEERAQAHPDKSYKLVGGYLRVAAAPLAGLTALDAIVREMTPRQARRSAILDNVRKDMNWLAWGESAEGLLADDPDMTIQDAADLITKDRAKVSKALKLLKVLNKAAREAIRVNYTTPGGYDLPEACGLCLGGLATGGEGDQELIERAVKVALDHRLDLVKTQKLVAWVKKGGQPEDFGAKEPKDTPEDPLASYWPQLGPGFKVKFKAGGGYEVRMAIQDGRQAWTAAMAAKRSLQGQVLATAQSHPAPNPTDSKPLHLDTFAPFHNAANLGSLIAGNELAKKLHLPKQVTNHLFPSFTRLFQRVIGLFEWMGIKNRVVATFLALLLVLFVGSNLISWSKRLLGRVVYSWVNSGTASQTNWVKPNPAPVQRPPVDGEALGVPIQAKEGIGAPAAREAAPMVASASNPPPAQVPEPAIQAPNTSVSKHSHLSTFTPFTDSAVSSKPQTAGASVSQKNDDPLKAIGDGVKDISHAVNTAKEGQSDVDKVKNLLGF